MPTQWYNIVSDMKNRPLPPLNPATKEPVTLEQMSALFAEELMKQEMSTERYIDIPEECRIYTRSTALPAGTCLRPGKGSRHPGQDLL